jgi:hypothetical protein
LYQFKDKLDYAGHFWFDKKLIEDKNWAMLSPAAKAIFPVIACHTNEKGEAFPGEQTIAILSGVTEKTVRSGLKGLHDFPAMKMESYITKRGRRSKIFKLSIPPKTSGRSFPFYKHLIESGLWSCLTPAAKALYPVLRSYSFFDYQTYTEIEGVEVEDDGVFRERMWESCEADRLVLAEFTGITRKSVYGALESLGEECLIESFSDKEVRLEKEWKVIVRTDMFYSRQHLNQRTMDRYCDAVVAP